MHNDFLFIFKFTTIMTVKSLENVSYNTLPENKIPNYKH